MKSHSVNEHFVRKVLVAQSCLTLCQPADCSPPGFSVHVIPQARILPFPSPEDLPNPGIEPGSSALQTESITFKLQGSSFFFFNQKKAIINIGFTKTQ